MHPAANVIRAPPPDRWHRRFCLSVHGFVISGLYLLYLVWTRDRVVVVTNARKGKRDATPRQGSDPIAADPHRHGPARSRTARALPNQRLRLPRRSPKAGGRRPRWQTNSVSKKRSASGSKRLFSGAKTMERVHVQHFARTYSRGSRGTNSTSDCRRPPPRQFATTICKCSRTTSGASWLRGCCNVQMEIARRTGMRSPRRCVLSFVRETKTTDNESTA